MGVTIQDLIEPSHLELRPVAGREALGRAIRWAHTSELVDPTPWLSGGELLLTTGMALVPAEGSAYVRRLAAAGVAGLGFGVGFGFDAVPAPLVRAADDAGFPILEVPFEVPFIAITEAISVRLTEDRLREARLSVEVHERLAALVAASAGPADVLDEVARLGGGWALLFDLSGGLIAGGESGAGSVDPAAVWDELSSRTSEPGGPSAASQIGPQGTQVAVPVTAGSTREGVLVFGKDRRLGNHERLVVHHATTVLGLQLAARRAVTDAQRRVMGDALGDACAGRLHGAELDRRLELLGFSGPALTVLVIEGGAEAGAAGDSLATAAERVLGMRTKTIATMLEAGGAAALVAHDDPCELAAALGRELGDGKVRVGVGEGVPPRGLRHSYLCARFALRAAPEGRQVASVADLGAYGFLLGAQSRPVLESFVRSVLGPLIEHDATRGSELVASVEAYIKAGGRWEPGAAALGVHRHTLRYRLRQADELLSRDLASEEGRLEVWLALKAAEILRE